MQATAQQAVVVLQSRNQTCSTQPRDQSMETDNFEQEENGVRLGISAWSRLCSGEVGR
jgi:hypothetical protein